MTVSFRPVDGFAYTPMVPLRPGPTAWRWLDFDGISAISCEGSRILKIARAALSRAFIVIDDKGNDFYEGRA